MRLIVIWLAAWASGCVTATDLTSTSGQGVQGGGQTTQEQYQEHMRRRPDANQCTIGILPQTSSPFSLYHDFDGNLTNGVYRVDIVAQDPLTFEKHASSGGGSFTAEGRWALWISALTDQNNQRVDIQRIVNNAPTGLPTQLATNWLAPKARHFDGFLVLPRDIDDANGTGSIVFLADTGNDKAGLRINLSW